VETEYGMCVTKPA